jgi:signal transduction histidine kinase
MVLSAGALVLRTVSLERGLRSNLPAPKAANPGGDSLEDLMGSVSLLVHDIRNSLAGLSGVIEILGRDLPASSGGKEIIEEARHEIRHIDEAVADFRARIETRTANPDPTGAGSPVKEK